MSCIRMHGADRTQVSESSRKSEVTQLELGLGTTGTVAERPRPTRCSELSSGSEADRVDAANPDVDLVDLHAALVFHNSVRVSGNGSRSTEEVLDYEDRRSR
jgi:hypothetical protein